MGDWASAIEASRRKAEEERRVVAGEEPSPAHAVTDRWARVREEARALGGDGLFGYLMWVERKCVDFGLHAMDRQWIWHFEQFYVSGKFLDVGRAGLRAAKSDSCCRAIVAEVLMIERKLEPTVVGVCPILSSKISEANDRVMTVKAVLRACGFQDLTGMRDPTVEHFQFRPTGGGAQPVFIELLDSQGHEVAFRIQPANEGGAAGYTGIAGFADELDLWGKPGGANPAASVFRILVTRYTTQPEAKLHAWSATYDRDSYHAELIKKGDTSLQRVARLGVDGAKKDDEDRARLAKAFGSTDPLLIQRADPLDVNIPAWVSNPMASIEDCYSKADENLRLMFGLYGGRPDYSGGIGRASAEDMLHIAARNCECFGPPNVSAMRRDGLIPIPGYDDQNQKIDPRDYRGL